MLNAHPEICIPFETDFLHFEPLACEFGDLDQRGNRRALLSAMGQSDFIRKAELIDNVDVVADYHATNFAELINNIFSRYAARQGKTIWGDKTPSYVTEMDRLRAHFPNCRIIHIVRDGRDVAISLANISWGSSHIPRVASDWRWKTVIGHKVGRALGPAYYQINYEELVLETESTLRSLCKHIGVAFNSAMLNYSRTAETYMPESSLQWHRTSILPPNAKKVNVWKKAMKRDQRILFDEYAGDALELFGYERYAGAPTITSKLLGLYYNVAKRW